MNQIVKNIKGKALPLRGNDIDTDRIIPARFLKCVTFDGLGEHAFQDDRFDQDGHSLKHPMDNPSYQGASILIVNKNFGCGSSREHAPQSLKRAGFDALIGESFAEIFFGNCLALGIPCVTMGEDDLDALQTQIEKNAAVPIELDLKTASVQCGESRYPVSIPASVQEQFLKGTWDMTDILKNNLDAVHRVANNLPYMQWSTRHGDTP